jgi:protein-disulfide isomerase
MYKERRNYAVKRLVWTLCIGVALSAPGVYGQSANDLKELRKAIEALKAGQRETQKTVQIIKDILMGKQPPLEDVYISTVGAQSQGNPTAKVTLIEFSDYQCPFCGHYANETYAKLIEKYVKTGKVRYLLRNFPLEQLHPLAEKAAEAAECAGEQGKYWDMHERLFKNQQALDAKEMAGHAVVLGLDQVKFQQCLDSGRFTAKVKADIADGIKVNVRGTPTFFFGYPDEKGPNRVRALKLLSGSQPLNEFTDILDALLNAPENEKETDASNP